MTNRGSFEVEESFVYDYVRENLLDEISEEERELMNMFIEQSRQNVENEETKEQNSSEMGAYYRICDIPTKQCDDSPLEVIEHPDRISTRKGRVFSHKGQMIHTDGTGKKTKLTKVYKRGDNRGVLLNALRRMRLNV